LAHKALRLIAELLGHMADCKVGRHRCVRVEGLMACQKTTLHEAQQVLQELADQAQELKLGY
jgi:hypothetical protein